MGQPNHVRTVIVSVVDDRIGTMRFSRCHVVVHHPAKHSRPATDIQMHNLAASGVAAQLHQGSGQRVAIIVVPEVRPFMFDNVLASVSDRLLQGIAGTDLRRGRLFAVFSRYCVEGRFVVGSY